MSIPFNANQEVCNQRSGVYAIVNVVTEKFYIGSAVKLNKRKNEHLRGLRKGKHDNRHLQNSYNKHGEEVFIFKTLEYVEDENNLLDVEQKYLDIYFHTGITYNICGIAGSCLGLKHSEETKQKLSKAHTGKILSDETKKKMSFAKQNMSDETKTKISEFQKGRKHSEETKKKMSESTEKKAVVQLDKNNNFISRFDSIVDAEKQTQILQENIGSCCSDRLKTAGGYLWMLETDYLNGKKYEESYLINGNSKPILQFTKNNEFVKKYNSLTEASKETGLSNISLCCSGKRKSAGGFIWQYESLYNQN